MEVLPQTTNVVMGLASHTSDATMEVTETSTKILAIIFEYALNKFDDSMERLAAGMP